MAALSYFHTTLPGSSTVKPPYIRANGGGENCRSLAITIGQTMKDDFFFSVHFDIMRSLPISNIQDYAFHGTGSTSLKGAKSSVELTELSVSTEPP
jgi:hypothetical protein